MIVWRRWLMVIVVVAGGRGEGDTGYGAGHAGEKHGDEEAKTDDAAATQPAEKDAPVVPVTPPLTVAPLAETVTAYGTVVAIRVRRRTGGVGRVRCAGDGRPGHAGQQVTQGMPIVQAQASPDALIALQEAKNAVEAAMRDLKQAEQRFADHSTNVELSSPAGRAIGKLKLEARWSAVWARSVSSRRRSRRHRQQGRCAGGPDRRRAAITACGTGRGKSASKCGWVSSRPTLQLLKPGQPWNAASRSVASRRPSRSRAKSASIGRRVDPATRCSKCSCRSPPNANLTARQLRRGKITRASADALVVPRSARCLPGEDGEAIFTVEDGKPSSTPSPRPSDTISDVQ